ncbi:THAP domain-containing protein 3-like [Oratosquilla oratoria]|uniref:THAP domain-containing protein 3-like n=1 Tax=Oratosquilla oratoria TaxID=337810 RepID=UPI003F763278
MGQSRDRVSAPQGCTCRWRFPCDDPKRLRKWLISVKWENWKPTKNSKICSEHFTEDCFDRTGQTVRLKLHAVPTIFNFPKHLQKVSVNSKLDLMGLMMGTCKWWFCERNVYPYHLSSKSVNTLIIWRWSPEDLTLGPQTSPKISISISVVFLPPFLRRVSSW